MTHRDKEYWEWAAFLNSGLGNRIENVTLRTEGKSWGNKWFRYKSINEQALRSAEEFLSHLRQMEETSAARAEYHSMRTKSQMVEELVGHATRFGFYCVWDGKCWRILGRAEMWSDLRFNRIVLTAVFRGDEEEQWWKNREQLGGFCSNQGLLQ